MAYKIGDIVQLKSGGPKMTIVSLQEVQTKNSQLYYAAWFAGSKHETARFPEEALIIPNLDIKKNTDA